jgi:transcriptional regulator with XRE-family HTH domain
MSDADRILSEFIDAWNAGRRPRVDEYLARADPDEREALAQALDDWLMLAPAPAYDEAARRAIREEPSLRAAADAVRRQPGRWPELLPSLRERAGIRLRDLAARVTAAFGLPGDEARAEAYLERMERGDLDPQRVSRRMLDALGAALGVSGAELARAGGLRPSAGAPAALFRAEEDAAASFKEELDALSRAAVTPSPAPMDELDRLFCGGRDA